MADLGAAALSAIAHSRPAAFPLAFAVGIVSSLGPCATPRTIAVAALLARARRPQRVGAAFLTGLLCAYVGLGLAGAELASSMTEMAGWLYGLIAAATVAGALWTIANATSCRADARPLPSDSLGMAVLSGAGFALVVSPCCTPVIGAVIGYSAFIGSPAMCAALLATFGFGHAAPVLATMAIGPRVAARVAASRWSQSAAIVSAGCLLWLGAFYAVLV